MMDCGIHPGFSGEASLPFLDTVDLDTVDVMLVTHFHLDHCAAVPYVVGRTNFKVPSAVLQLQQMQHCVSRSTIAPLLLYHKGFVGLLRHLILRHLCREGYL